MSTNANYQIVYGTRISKSLAKKMNDEFGENLGRIMRRYVEKLVEYNNTNEEGFYLWNVDHYIKHNEDGTYKQPVEVLWSDYSPEELLELEEDFDYALRDKIYKRPEGQSPKEYKEAYELFWHPCSDYSMEPIFGIKGERLFSGIAWDFQKILKKKVYELPSTMPWETGVHEARKSGAFSNWQAFNGSMMIHKKDNLPDEEEVSIRRGFPTKDECIANQKRIWDKYNTRHKPYPLMANEMWYWSYPTWHSVDIFIQACQEIWPELENNPEKYKKFLLFHWS
jgi:hypothetical protein